MSNLTLKTIQDAMQRMKDLTRVPSVKIVYTHHAMKDSEVRIFPASKNRSARIRKKLIKRFGGEFKRVPAMWRVGDTIYAHPNFEWALAAGRMMNSYSVPMYDLGYGVFGLHTGLSV